MGCTTTRKGNASTTSSGLGSSLIEGFKSFVSRTGRSSRTPIECSQPSPRRALPAHDDVRLAVLATSLGAGCPAHRHVLEHSPLPPRGRGRGRGRETRHVTRSPLAATPPSTLPSRHAGGDGGGDARPTRSRAAHSPRHHPALSPPATREGTGEGTRDPPSSVPCRCGGPCAMTRLLYARGDAR
jgi:hypothetical protein